MEPKRNYESTMQDVQQQLSTSVASFDPAKKEMQQELTIDQLISRAENDIEQNSVKLDETGKSIIDRITEYLTSCTFNEENQYRSSKMQDYDEDIYRKYTKKSRIELQEHAANMAKNEFNILRDSIYPNSIEYKYCEYLEKKRHKQFLHMEQCNIDPTRKRNISSHNKPDKIFNTRSRNKMSTQVSVLRFEESDASIMSENRAKPHVHSFVQKTDLICQVCNGTEYSDSNNILICSVTI